MPDSARVGGQRGHGFAALGTLVLPDGREIACQTKTEALFFYRDIFEKRIYTRHGVTLDGAECVFDVGANVGLFSLFVSRHRPRAAIYAFEPAPALFRSLRANTAGHAGRLRLFECGVSNRPGTAELTFYANSSGMSSFYGDPGQERRVLRAILENQRQAGTEGMEEVMRHAEELLEERLHAETVRCRLETLSRVIRDDGIERIDLLKVDVQKSEEDVLAGIEPRDWPKVRQVAMEVHDLDGRLDRVRELLGGHGFRLAWEQDDLYEGSEMYNLYAVRGDGGSRPADRSLPSVARRRERLREALARQDGEAGGGGGTDG